MQKMVRKQIYLEAAQDETLKRRAKETGLAEAELIRASLDYFFNAVGEGGSAKKGPSMIRETPAVYAAGPPVVGGDAMAEFIRKALKPKDRRSFWGVAAAEDRAAWKKELEFMEERSKLKTEGGARGWTREELYDERV